MLSIAGVVAGAIAGLVRNRLGILLVGVAAGVLLCAASTGVAEVAKNVIESVVSLVGRIVGSEI